MHTVGGIDMAWKNDDRPKLVPATANLSISLSACPACDPGGVLLTVSSAAESFIQTANLASESGHVS